MIHENIELPVKRGAQQSFIATFDTTNLPSGSLNEIVIEWFAKRTLWQSGSDIYKTSTDSDQITVLDPTAGTVRVNLLQADTQNLTPGDYYWAFQLSSGSVGFNVKTISPDTTHGVLTVLDSIIF